MTKNKQKLISGGSKGGRSKSPRKRQAALKNLQRANEGKKLAKRIALLDWKIANNRLLREQATDSRIIQILDGNLEETMRERQRLAEEQKRKYKSVHEKPKIN